MKRMNFKVPALIASLLMASFTGGAEPPITGVQVEKRFKDQNYLFFLPQGYKKSEQSWPLMLFLHGGGECGTNLAKLKVSGPPMLADDDPAFPFILVSPQSPKPWGWNHDTLIALLDDVISKYRVDSRRIYLTGISMGGFVVWSLAAEHPDKFAAIVPICGAGNVADAKKLSALPIWVFHGAKDDTVPVQQSRIMVAAIKAAGGHVKYTEYPETGHICWTQTYDNPRLFQWLLDQNTDKSRAPGAKALPGK
jgi:predicted peptidase